MNRQNPDDFVTAGEKPAVPDEMDADWLMPSVASTAPISAEPSEFPDFRPEKTDGEEHDATWQNPFTDGSNAD